MRCLSYMGDTYADDLRLVFPHPRTLHVSHPPPGAPPWTPRLSRQVSVRRPARRRLRRPSRTMSGSGARTPATRCSQLRYVLDRLSSRRHSPIPELISLSGQEVALERHELSSSLWLAVEAAKCTEGHAARARHSDPQSVRIQFELTAVHVSRYLSAQADHVLKVLRRPGDFGLTPGVWYAVDADGSLLDAYPTHTLAGVLGCGAQDLGCLAGALERSGLIARGQPLGGKESSLSKTLGHTIFKPEQTDRHVDGMGRYVWFAFGKKPAHTPAQQLDNALKNMPQPLRRSVYESCWRP